MATNNSLRGLYRGKRLFIVIDMFYNQWTLIRKIHAYQYLFAAVIDQRFVIFNIDNKTLLNIRIIWPGRFCVNELAAVYVKRD